MDEFMASIHETFPELVIQHEDIATERAFDVRVLIVKSVKRWVGLY